MIVDMPWLVIICTHATMVAGRALVRSPSNYTETLTIQHYFSTDARMRNDCPQAGERVTVTGTIMSEQYPALDAVGTLDATGLFRDRRGAQRAHAYWQKMTRSAVNAWLGGSTGRSTGTKPAWAAIMPTQPYVGITWATLTRSP